MKKFSKNTMAKLYRTIWNETKEAFNKPKEKNERPVVPDYAKGLIDMLCLIMQDGEDKRTQLQSVFNEYVKCKRHFNIVE